jgi:hypothetical protein
MFVRQAKILRSVQEPVRGFPGQKRGVSMYYQEPGDDGQQ